MTDMQTGQAVTSKTKVKLGKKVTVKAKVNDALTTVAQEIENLTQDQVINVAMELIDSSGMNDFRLGGVLLVIQRNGWFEGYESFRALVEEKFGLHYRKAMYLIQIYNDLVEKQIPWEKVQHLGWTKLKEIAHILTPDNVNSIVKMANGMTVLQLQDYVKAQSKKKANGQAAEGGDEVTSTVTTMTFKVHPDQKEVIREALDKAKADLSTEFDTVALEGICSAFLGNSVQIDVKTVSLKDVMAKHTYEEVLQIFEQCFPDVDLMVQT